MQDFRQYGFSSILGDIRFFSQTIKKSDLEHKLDSNAVENNLLAVKMILAMICAGRDLSEYLPRVMKFISSSSLELKKLSYLVILHYTDFNEETRTISLLSINTFQKDLTRETNPVLRALAIKTLLSIASTDIVHIQLHLLKNAIQDVSPYVRKAACLSLLTFAEKLVKIDPVLEVLKAFAQDKSILVLGASIQVFHKLSPQQLSIYVQQFERILNSLLDFEENALPAVLFLLTRLCRYCFRDPRIDETLHHIHAFCIEEVKFLTQLYNPAILFQTCLFLVSCTRLETDYQIQKLIARCLIRLMLDPIVSVRMSALELVLFLLQQGLTTFRESLYFQRKLFYIKEDEMGYSSFLRDKCQLLVVLFSSNKEDIHTLLEQFDYYLFSIHVNAAKAVLHWIPKLLSSVQADLFIQDILVALTNVSLTRKKDLSSKAVISICRLLSNHEGFDDVLVDLTDLVFEGYLSEEALVELISSNLQGWFAQEEPKVKKLLDLFYFLVKDFVSYSDNLKILLLLLYTALRLISSVVINEEVERYICEVADFDDSYLVRRYNSEVNSLSYEGMKGLLDNFKSQQASFRIDNRIPDCIKCIQEWTSEPKFISLPTNQNSVVSPVIAPSSSTKVKALKRVNLEDFYASSDNGSD